MTTDAEPDVEPAGLRKPFQFGLAAMFIVTTAFAAVLALCFVLPRWLAGPAILALVIAIPGVLLTAAKYGSGNVPAFCIGALMPTGMSLFGLFFCSRWEIVINALREANQNVLLARTDHLGLDALGAWILLAREVGCYWRPVAVSSWFAAILMGLLCVGVRRMVQWRG